MNKLMENISKKFVFSRTIAPYDIALLELEVDLKFNEFVQPIELPWQDEEFVGISTMSGWGTTDIYKEHETLLKTVDLPIITVEGKELIKNIVPFENMTSSHKNNMVTSHLFK